MTLLKVNKVNKAYHAPVLVDLSMHLEKDSITSLLGQSGSGKSTLFNLIAGLEKADQGTILLEDQPIALGKTAYMQQKDLLLPYLNVLDNCLLPLRLQKVPVKEAEAKGLKLLEEVGLADLAKRYPHELSGGMRQRVAFVRTLLTGQKLLLLDEPFSALDAFTRRKLQEWYLQMAKKFGLTTFLITHDIDEALSMSDRVLVLQNGRIGFNMPVPTDKDTYLLSETFLQDKAKLYQFLDQNR